MSKKSVFCIAVSRDQADQIVERLKNAKFCNKDISVLFPNKITTRDFAYEQGTKAQEGTVTGAKTGGLVGGALGWLASVGALVIPGVGPFIAAGPIIAALSGAAFGAAVGGITGGLIGMGIPEFKAKVYEDKIKQGNVLISVHTENLGQIAQAKEIFREAGAHDICTTGEAPLSDDSTTPRAPASAAIYNRTTGEMALKDSPTTMRAPASAEVDNHTTGETALKDSTTAKIPLAPA